MSTRKSGTPDLSVKCENTVGSPLAQKDIEESLAVMNQKGYYLERFYQGFKDNLVKRAGRLNSNSSPLKENNDKRILSPI